jgi:hypothetical protein
LFLPSILPSTCISKRTLSPDRPPAVTTCTLPTRLYRYPSIIHSISPTTSQYGHLFLLRTTTTLPSPNVSNAQPDPNSCPKTSQHTVHSVSPILQHLPLVKYLGRTGRDRQGYPRPNDPSVLLSTSIEDRASEATRSCTGHTKPKHNESSLSTKSSRRCRSIARV